MKKMERHDESMVDIFDQTASRYPNRKALVMVHGKEMTFIEVLSIIVHICACILYI